MAEALVSMVSLFFPSLLLFYWSARALLLMRRSEEEVTRVLDSDLWLGRRMWLAVRLMFAPPQTFSL